VGIRLSLGLGVGSTYSGTANAWAGSNYYSATGATSVVGTNGATFYITGVQLEVGSSATGFEYRQYGQELALCQRYYYKNSLTTVNTSVVSGSIYNTGSFYSAYPTKVTMRASPTFSVNSVSDYRVLGNVSQTTTNDVSSSNTSPDVVEIYAGYAGSSQTTGQAAVLRSLSTSAWIALSAEL
jgi:hypothetical protein